MVESLSIRNTPNAGCRWRHKSTIGWILVILLLGMQSHGLAQNFDKAKYLQARLAKTALAKTLEAGNSFYKIVIEAGLGRGVGLYSVSTGRDHPVTRALGEQDLLLGASNGLTGTSYTTIHSYTTNSDYVQTDLAKSDTGITTVWLDTLFVNDFNIDTNFVRVEPLKAGYRVTYELPGLPQLGRAIRDTMTIIQ